MSDPESPQVRDATPPFDNPRRADVILRSSDLVDFHVYKLILSLASPVFETMFTLPTTSSSDTMMADDDDHRHGLSVVNLTEDSCTLDAILRACYPNVGPHLDGLDAVFRILQAAEKYEIRAFDDLAKARMESFVEAEPVRAYVIACRFGFKEVAVRAARSCLRLVFDDLVTERPPELASATSLQYQNLLQYHRKCGKIASQITASCEWFQECHQMLIPNLNWDEIPCKCLTTRRGRGRWYGPDYLWTYLARAGEVLRERPIAAVVYDASVLTPVPNHICQSCRIDRTGNMVQFARLLASAITEALGRVRVSLRLNEDMVNLG